VVQDKLHFVAWKRITGAAALPPVFPGARPYLANPAVGEVDGRTAAPAVYLFRLDVRPVQLTPLRGGIPAHLIAVGDGGFIRRASITPDTAISQHLIQFFPPFKPF
jgi:hypothetical protein